MGMARAASGRWWRLALWAGLLGVVILGPVAVSGCVRTYAAAEDVVTIRSSYWGAVEDIAVWEELARRFHARQNRIRVKLEHIAGQDYHSKLMAMTVGRCAPDVMASDDEPFQHLAANGLFEDLTPYLGATADRRPPTADAIPAAEPLSGSKPLANTARSSAEGTRPDSSQARNDGGGHGTRHSELARNPAGSRSEGSLIPVDPEAEALFVRPRSPAPHSPEPRLTDFYRPFRETFQNRGRQFGLPYIGHCMLVYYNRDHRRAAGLPPDPDPDWTWEEFTRDAVALTRDVDGDGRVDQFGLNRLGWFYCLQWVWSAGGRDMDPGLTHYLFDTAEARRGFQFHYDHMHKYRVCPMVSDLPNMTWDSMFMTQKVSMFCTGSWWLAHCRTAKNIDWDVAPMPRGPVTRATRTTCEALTISAASAHKKEAWEWVKFVLSEEGQPLFAQHGRGIPGLRRVALKAFPRPDTRQHEERFLEAMDQYARRSSIHERWPETARVFDREWDRVESGRKTVDDFVRTVVPEANAIVRGERP